MLQKELVNQGNWLFRWRSLIPLLVYFTYIIGIILNIFQPLNCSFTTQYLLVCVAISIVGVVVRAITVATTPDGTSGRNTKSQRAEQLNQTGIYSMVRHPLYLGNYLMWLGLLLFTGNLYFVILASAFYFFYYERIMLAEEDFLSQQNFGNEWRQWALKTPAFMPKLSNYIKNKAKFNWKAILKREYSGWLTLAISFTFIEWVKRFQISNNSLLNFSYLYLVVFFAILALFLKFLKRKTAFLDD